MSSPFPGAGLSAREKAGRIREIKHLGLFSGGLFWGEFPHKSTIKNEFKVLFLLNWYYCQNFHIIFDKAILIADNTNLATLKFFSVI